MKKLVFALIFLSLMLPSQLFADGEQCNYTKYLNELWQKSDRVVFTENKEADEQLLFYRFTEEQSVGANDVVEFEFRVDGEVSLVEEVRILPEEVAEAEEIPYPLEELGEFEKGSYTDYMLDGTVVEILASNPVELDNLFELALEDRSIDVVVRVGSSLEASVPFAELVLFNRAMKPVMPLPRPVASEVIFNRLESASVHIADLRLKDACTQYCQDEFQTCMEDLCNYEWCSGCQFQYDQCMDWCGGGGCTPDTDVVTHFQRVGFNPTTTFACLWVPPFYNFTNVFQKTKAIYRFTRTTTTTYADCTTDVDIETWYAYTYCWMDYYPPYCPGGGYPPSGTNYCIYLPSSG